MHDPTALERALNLMPTAKAKLSAAGWMEACSHAESARLFGHEAIITITDDPNRAEMRYDVYVWW